LTHQSANAGIAYTGHIATYAEVSTRNLPRCEPPFASSRTKIRVPDGRGESANKRTLSGNCCSVARWPPAAKVNTP